jgi:hypothetical protein
MKEPTLFIVSIALVGALTSGSRLYAADEERASPTGRRLTVGGEVSLTGSVGDRGWFNETEYERSTLKLARFGLLGELRAGQRLALLSEVRSENLDTPRAYALYLRLRPWSDRNLDIQAGRIPPVFGAFGRRSYGVDNPLAGLPLAYQYLTTLRADAVPSSADELLHWRGDGWLVRYSVGSPSAKPGLPLVATLRWDTGIQVRVGSRSVDVSAAVTQGALSNPRTRDDNGGKQVSLRLEARPVLGLVLGASGARGEYVGRDLGQQLPQTLASHGYRQRALGFDLEWSRGHGIVRTEAVWSEWDIPAVSAPFIDGPLRALGLSLEGRYKLAPGLYAAARLDRLGFSRIRGSAGSLSWDAPVTRAEAGIGFAIRRNVWLKGVFQHNWRDGGLVRSQSIGAVQASLWF